MVKNIFILLMTCFMFGCATLTYEESLQSWDSYKDVGRWLDINFRYQYHPWNRPIKKPEDLYRTKWGNCIDASRFATETLNKINPDYNARLIYLHNSLSWKGHYATAFEMDGKLYVIDYGTNASNNSAWKRMEGVHGPYTSLDEYKEFVNSLHLQGFHFRKVIFQSFYPSTAM